MNLLYYNILTNYVQVLFKKICTKYERYFLTKNPVLFQAQDLSNGININYLVESYIASLVPEIGVDIEPFTVSKPLALEY